jgi:hypothetical protein
VPEGSDLGVDAGSPVAGFSVSEWSTHIWGDGNKLSIWLVFQSIPVPHWGDCGFASFDEELEKGKNLIEDGIPRYINMTDVFI